MLYKDDREKMNKEVAAYKKLVWRVIMATFALMAVLLVAFCVTLAIDVFSDGVFGTDNEAPKIVGPTGNRVIGYVGDSPVYKKMITVTDNMDEHPEIKVDNSKVNTQKTGTYKVYYTVTDESGNEAKYTLTYVVKKAEYSETQLMTLIADKAKDLGIKKSMSKTEKVRAIYEYVNDEETIKFNKKSNIPNIDRENWETDWIEEAVRTLESGKGDCYSYYSLSKAFFEYFDIDNEGIKRSENYEDYDEDHGTHFWSAVKVEEGWYYYDSTRLAGKFSDKTNNACLITEKKLNSYVGSKGETYFYTMTKSEDFPTMSKKELD